MKTHALAVAALLSLPQHGARELWLDPAWQTGPRPDEIARVIIHFDRQLLDGGDAYARATERYANADRRTLRRDIVAQLKALNVASMRAAEPALKQLERDGIVANCEPHWIVNSVSCDLPGHDPAPLRAVPGAVRAFRGFGRQATPPPPVTPRTQPCRAADSYRPDTARAPWNARMLNVHRVWGELGLTGRGVLNVVHDFGWTLASPPTLATLWCNEREVAGNNRDDDGNGLIDDVHGFNFDRGDAAINDLTGGPALPGGMTHGDLTAAVLAGRDMRDSAYVVGIAPGSRWAAIQSSLSIEPGVEWALEQNADSYSMSFSLPNLGHLRSHWRRVMEHGALAGLFFVSGAGNFANQNAPNYAPPPVQMRIPEDVPLAVLGVSGVGSNGERPIFSSQGPVQWQVVDYNEGEVGKPDLATINFNLLIVDTLGNANARNGAGWGGNSFAGPHTAGILALMIEADPALTPWRARDILVQTARDIGAPGFDHQYGAGLADAYAAVSEVIRRRK